MSGTDELTEQFEANRPRLQAVAHRMLGSRREDEQRFVYAGYGAPGGRVTERPQRGTSVLAVVVPSGST